MDHGAAASFGFSGFGFSGFGFHLAWRFDALAWMFAEWIISKKPSVLGMVSGAVAGLVAITPASGFVDAKGAPCCRD